MDSDDAYYEPTVIARVVETLQKYPDVDVVYGHAALDQSGLGDTTSVLGGLIVSPLRYGIHD